jgi:predicted MFS family arabinose efflux permease
MAQSNTPLMLDLSAGVLIGLSLSASSFAVVLGAVGRSVSEQRRSLALGIASAGGSLGQLIMLPISHGLIAWSGWPAALTWLGGIALLIIPLAFVLRGSPGWAASSQQSMGQALREASGHRGYWLLTAGFFVCGFHVTFIGTHLPAYIADHGLAPGLGAVALAVIGGFNVLGSYFWGAMGGRHSKKKNLASLYLIRAVVMTGLLAFPVTQVTILLFAAAIGFLWLGTVPLTSALVGQMFGMRYLSTLFGIVFLSHQVGASLGVWLGGWVYDKTGSYDAVWYIAIALGLISALLHWPIDERPVERLASAVPVPSAGGASY